MTLERRFLDVGPSNWDKWGILYLIDNKLLLTEIASYLCLYHSCFKTRPSYWDKWGILYLIDNNLLHASFKFLLTLWFCSCDGRLHSTATNVHVLDHKRRVMDFVLYSSNWICVFGKAVKRKKSIHESQRTRVVRWMTKFSIFFVKPLCSLKNPVEILQFMLIIIRFLYAFSITSIIYLYCERFMRLLS